MSEIRLGYRLVDICIIIDKKVKRSEFIFIICTSAENIYSLSSANWFKRTFFFLWLQNKADTTKEDCQGSETTKQDSFECINTGSTLLLGSSFLIVIWPLHKISLILTNIHPANGTSICITITCKSNKTILTTFFPYCRFVYLSNSMAILVYKDLTELQLSWHA